VARLAIQCPRRKCCGWSGDVPAAMLWNTSARWSDRGALYGSI